MKPLRMQGELLSLLAGVGKKTIKSSEKIDYSNKWGGVSCPLWSLVQRKEIIYLKKHYTHSELKEFGYDSWTHERGGAYVRFDLSIDTDSNHVVASLDHHTLVDPNYYREADGYRRVVDEYGRREWGATNKFFADVVKTIENDLKSR